MTTPESGQQRLERIADEILSNRKTMNDVRLSVDRLAGRAPGDYSGVDDSGYQTREQIIARLQSIFTNRGVDLSIYRPGQTPPSATVPPGGIIGGPAGPPQRQYGPRPGEAGIGSNAGKVWVPNPPGQPGPAGWWLPPNSDGSTPEPPRPTGKPPAPGPAPATPPVDEFDRDAYARLGSLLGDYGLAGLASQVQRWLIEGLSEDEITQRMRDTNEFKDRFKGIVEREKRGLPAISPGEYVAYERSVAQMMRAAGMPTGFYDSVDDFTNFIVNDLSLSELGDRVTLAANAAFNAPQETRDALAQWGVGPGELTAFWLDPDKAQPLLERKYAAAQLAGTATRTTFGQLDESTATDLAQMGVTQQQAEQGFGRLVESKELFQSLDSTEDVIGTDDQIAAELGGNAAARRRIARRQKQRLAQFQGGGGYASSQSGLVGLGDASA